MGFPSTTRCLLALACLSLSAFGATFPKPEPAKAFAELKLYDATGNPWRSAIEDWDGARQRAANDPAWRTWLHNEKSAVDKWIAKRADRVEWRCGWWHDFVSPKDGSYLEWTEQTPGEEVQFLHSKSDPHVEITPKIFGGWVFAFRGRHSDMMVRAARLYRLTGDEHYAQWAAAQLDFYAANYLKWEENRDGARLYWQTLDVATNMVKYADTVRLLDTFATAERRTTWQRDFFQPQVVILNRERQNIHNIATWHRCAVAQVALLFHDEAMWRDALDSRYGLRRQMTEGITSEYIWWEQSLHYNSYVVQAVLTLFETAGLYGRAAELSDEMSIAENLMLAPIVLRFPDGKLPNPADSTSIPVAPNRELLADAARVFPTALGLNAVAGRHDWETLLDPPASAPAARELPEVKSLNLASSRMALLHSGPWQVFMHYGQLTSSHAEAETLHYSAYFGTTDVTHDCGTVGYGSPLHKDYYTRGVAHNVPLVDGEGLEKFPEAGELLSYSPTRVAAAQPHYRRDATADRTLAIEGDRLIDETHLKLTTGTAAKHLGLTVHVQGKARLSETMTADDTFATGRAEPFAQWKSVRKLETRDRVEFDVDYGAGVVLHVTLACAGPFTLWHGDTPDFPPHRRESFYLETTGTAATFTTTFAPAAAKQGSP